MKHPLHFIVPALLLLACNDRTYLDPNYCGNNDGDNFCAQQTPDRPYCVFGDSECLDASNIDRSGNGCAVEMPSQECGTPCGIGNGESCVDPTDPTIGSSSSSTTDESSSSTEPDTDTSDTSTTSSTGPECTDNTECTTPGAPLCIDDACVPCTDAVDVSPDEACADFDAATPLCIEDACVACTAEDIGSCGDTTPLCDAELNACVACEFHEQCQDPNIGSPACNIATGACFDPANVTEVSLSAANALQNAVNGVADGAEHAIVITGGAGLHTVSVDGGKTIAIVSSSSVVRGINGNAAAVLTLSGEGTTLYLHRVRLEDSDDVGIAVTSSATLYADSVQVAQNSGGGITLASGTTGFIRNSMIGGSADVTTLDASSATVDLLYSSVLGGLGDAEGFICSSGANITIRNAIITTRGGTAALACAGADVSSTAVEDSGMTSWFADYNGGDAHLSAAGQTQFMGRAEWSPGDPPFDFDGDPRPDASNLPGADVP